MKGVASSQFFCETAFWIVGTGVALALEGCSVARFTTATADAVFVDVLGSPCRLSNPRRCGPCRLMALNARTIRLEDGNDVMLPEDIPSPKDNGGRAAADVAEVDKSELVDSGGGVESGKVFADAGLEDGNTCVESRGSVESGRLLVDAGLDDDNTCVESRGTVESGKMLDEAGLDDDNNCVEPGAKLDPCWLDSDVNEAGTDVTGRTPGVEEEPPELSPES